MSYVVSACIGSPMGFALLLGLFHLIERRQEEPKETEKKAVLKVHAETLSKDN